MPEKKCFPSSVYWHARALLVALKCLKTQIGRLTDIFNDSIRICEAFPHFSLFALIFQLEGLILYPRLVNIKVEKIRRKDLRKIHTNWLLRSSKTYCKRYKRTVRERVLFINSVQKIKNKNHLQHACVYTLIITNTTNFCCSHQILKKRLYLHIDW